MNKETASIQSNRTNVLCLQLLIIIFKRLLTLEVASFSPRSTFRTALNRQLTKLSKAGPTSQGTLAQIHTYVYKLLTKVNVLQYLSCLPL